MSASECRRVLLTGSPGVGKTTVCEALFENLKSRGISVAGFVTKELRQQQYDLKHSGGGASGRSRIGFDVIRLEDGSRAVLSRLAHMASFQSNARVGNYLVNVAEFQSFALPTLRLTDENSVLIIDEIGKMELFSDAFERRIHELFSQSRRWRIVATVPLRSQLPLVRTLKHDQNNHLVEVTRDNRGYILEEVLQLLDLEN